MTNHTRQENSDLDGGLEPTHEVLLRTVGEENERTIRVMRPVESGGN